MARSRSLGSMSSTMRSPIRIEPALTSSSPASIRRAVDLPGPDGPTSTMNSPWRTSRVTAWTAVVPSSNVLVTPAKPMLAMRRSPLLARAAGPVDVVPVEERAGLGRARLRVEVHVDDPEALVVALLPLEVVEQRPDVVTAHVGAVGDGLAQGLEMARQVRAALGVLDAAVDHRPVLEGRAVLGDQDRQPGVLLAHAGEDPAQAVGGDLPTHAGRRADGFGVGDVQRRDGGRLDAHRVVVVDAEEVDRRADGGQVA